MNTQSTHLPSTKDLLQLVKLVKRDNPDQLLKLISKTHPETALSIFNSITDEELLQFVKRESGDVIRTLFTFIADSELVQLVKQGNREAVAVVFDKYSEDLFIYSIQIAGARIRGYQLQEDAKEILIRVFDSFWTARKFLPDTLHLEDYLFSVAYQHALNYVGLDRTMS